MHKAASLLLCLLLILPWAACAEQPTPAPEASPSPLLLEELTLWRDLMQETWAPMTPEESQGTGEGGYRLDYPFGTVDASAASLNASMNPVQGFTLVTNDYEDPRGLTVGASVADVLAAYPVQNPALQGDAHYASLYAYAEEDMAETDTLGWAWVLRSQETITALQYNVSQRQADGTYVEAGILYTIEDDEVTAIQLYGFDRTTTEEEARANLKSVQDLAIKDSFTPGAAEAAQEATRFDADDLAFAGFHFQKSTPEAILTLFGTPQSDEEILDEGEQVRIISYPDAMFEFRIGSYGEAALSSVLVQMHTLTGPRGIRVGDTLGDVLDTFYRNDNVGNDTINPLYGDGETPPFGLLSFQEGGSATVRYGYQEQDEAGNDITYLLRLAFQDEVLTEYMLYSTEEAE